MRPGEGAAPRRSIPISHVSKPDSNRRVPPTSCSSTPSGSLRVQAVAEGRRELSHGVAQSTDIGPGTEE
jgi:hypothetical protein